MSAIIRSALVAVRSNIATACTTCTPPRAIDTINIIAVSKHQLAIKVRDAHSLGLRDFGENFVQAAVAKANELAELNDCVWHLLGPLQSNKTAAAARLFTWIHSLDRLKTARLLGVARTAAGLPPLQACIQVNLSDEASKAGLSPAEVPAFCHTVQQIDGLQVRGLMCIPEAGLDEDESRARFSQLADLLQQCQTTIPKLDTLSMGMSADYTIAIECGATMVRLGTVLFGQRA